jgi:hypothetical protein
MYTEQLPIASANRQTALLITPACSPYAARLGKVVEFSLVKTQAAYSKNYGAATLLLLDFNEPSATN